MVESLLSNSDRQDLLTFQQHVETNLKENKNIDLIVRFAQDLIEQPLKTIKVGYISIMAQILNLHPYFIRKYIKYRLLYQLRKIPSPYKPSTKKALSIAIQILDHLIKIDSQQDLLPELQITKKENIRCPYCLSQINTSNFFCPHCSNQVKIINLRNGFYL
jgi:hypothetical protein